MEDDGVEGQEANSDSRGCEGGRSVGVRSRWNPKAEQIQILESIFNSGMVNPPKQETLTITKLLQKFGTVCEANVFYWFQNRRSRSRRRHRQSMLQAELESNHHHPLHPHDHQLVGVTASTNPYDHMYTDQSSSASEAMEGFGASSLSLLAPQQPPTVDPFFSVSAHHHMAGLPQIDPTSSPSPPTSLPYPPHPSNFDYFPGYITVFINGVATEVPMGPMDMKIMFGEDVMLVHSSGVPLPTNEFGFLIQDLLHGESYFLVSKPT